MSGNKSVEFRYSQINSFKESGMSVAAWCKENKMKAPTLRYWLNKIKVGENTNPIEGGWVSIAVNNPVHTEVPPIVIKIGAFSIEIQHGFDRSTLTDVIATIHGSC